MLKFPNSCLVLVLVLFSSILTQPLLTTKSEVEYWPTEEWLKSSPRKQEMDGKLLDDMIDYMEGLTTHVDSIVVIKNGYIVQEGYFGLYESSWKHALWSVTKSFICSLIGIALKEGYIESVNEKVLDFFPDRNISNLDSRKEAMEIRHLLAMTTGMAYPGDDEIWPGWMTSEDQVLYILDLPMATDPGAIFNYDTGGTHLLSAIIQEVTGNTTLEFAIEYLFNPLGIDDIHWERDRTGVYYGGHGLFLTTRDIAKLGYLYLNNGTWDGEQILPENWVEDTTNLYWNLGNDWAYGKLWWLHPSLGIYHAAGRYGQHVYVIPEHNIIVAVTASLSVSDPEPYLYVIQQYILPAVENVTLPLDYIIGMSIPIICIIIIVRLKKSK
ncbi:MAG: serine hydrolase [Candidatus Heimdallarchaeota archaeon]